MAEFQLAGFLADLVHGEVHDPAELVALLVHVARAGGAQHLAEYTGGLLSGEQLAGGEADEVSRASDPARMIRACSLTA